MAKVALINPGKDQKYAVQEPLSLGFIASYLEKNDVEVSIIDELAGQNIEKEMNLFCPDIVGITATTPLVSRAYRIADMCRKMGILTVMGGVHASVMPEEALRHADVVVKGEGEIAMLDIVKNNIRSGIISRPYIKNIDEVPPPARHLMDMNFYTRTKDRLPDTYLYFVPSNTLTASIFTSRGCPYDCIFCHNTWKDTPYRFNSIERVILEIKELIKVYGIKALFFIEDNLFVNKRRILGICEMMKQNKIDIMWGCSTRVDNVDLEILQAAKEVGCRQVTFGFESGSQKILDVLNKKTTVEQNRKAIELCNLAGIIPNGTFMIGNPNETIEDIKTTIKFIEDNDIKSMGICISTPYPGTQLWKWYRDHNRITKTVNWSDFSHDKLSVNFCNTISLDVLRKLKLEMERTFFLRKKTTITLSKTIIKSLQNPSRAIAILSSVIKNPSTLPALLKRIRL